MPPAFIDLDSDSDTQDEPEPRANIPSQYSQQSLIPVIQRATTKPVPARQYPDGPLPLRPSDNAPRNAHITGRVADDDGVYYTLMVGQLEINEVSVTEILDFVSAYDLEEYENSQFIEEEDARKIAKAVAEAEREAKRLRKLERIRNKGIVFFEERNADPESNEDGEMVVGRHGRARPTYTHLYKLPGGGQDGTKRRRRKRDPSTGELIPLSDEEGNALAMNISDEEMELRRELGRSQASQASPLVSGLQPPKRRRRKRDPATGELIPLSGDEKGGSSDGGMAMQQSARSSSIQMPEQFTEPVPVRGFEQSEMSRSISSTQPPPTRSSPMRRAPPSSAMELPKRRRRRRDPRTGELVPLDPEPQQVTAQSTTPMRDSFSASQATEERKKRPRRRRHPITGAWMPLGWVYDPKAETKPYQATAEVTSMSNLSIARESKRMKITSEPSSDDMLSVGAGVGAGARSPIASPQIRKTQVVELSDSSSSSEGEQDGASSEIKLSIERKPAPSPLQQQQRKASTQVLSPKHGMMQRARSYSSSNEPITLQSFLSTTATVRADRTDHETSSEDSSSGSEIRVKETTASQTQKTTMINPIASQSATAKAAVDDNSEDEDENVELGEGEFFISGIHAHHMSDPRTHPGQPQVMLYQTKWVGWTEMTWEPAGSFEDVSVLEEYRRRVGLKGRA